MSYLVLARKWRPRSFADVVGQEHVVRALANALTSDRVHHAYLFAGTRGVGKTTIARILAKALNCREGVSAEPCGECVSCQAVDDGRFVDLIEVDAASRTGVDDTRELLENVQYTPSSGRFKVYLIDEVHMLSRQSFNALLKTLEEPPPHVKFLFATTDPQKLPVTVLSRCLQFNLKRLSNKLIVARMAQICEAERLEHEPAALTRLARAATGSMRDALSLLDQALAYGDNRLTDADVGAMLGSMDRHRIIALLDALAAGEASPLLAQLRQLDALVPDYEDVLSELATALERIAVIQLAGRTALEDDEEDLAALERLAEAFDPELVQLLYQIAVTSRRDLGLAPDPRLGFEMAMLRMLVFRPATDAGPGALRDDSSRARPPRPAPTPLATAIDDNSPQGVETAPVPASLDDLEDWPSFVAGLGVGGAVRQLAENSALVSSSPFELELSVERRNEHLLTEKLKERLIMAIHERTGGGIKVRFRIIDQTVETAAARAAQQAVDELQNARDSIEHDPSVQQLKDMFGAEVIPESVRAVPGDPAAD